MKRMWPLVLVLVMMSACNNSAEVTVKVDSLGRKLDTIAKNAWDSTKKGVRNLEEKINEKLDKNDSADHK
jgi:hypothetical protein